MLKGKKIVIGITGSIAAYKIPLLVRLLVKENAEVQVIMTPAARDFITPLTLSTLSRRNVIIDPFNPKNGEWNNHVELGQWADAMIFAPVSANTIAKMSHGIADNFLVTAYLSAKCPVFIAPAMDLDMYAHPSTRSNIRILREYGNIIIEPRVGELASGLSGPGRLEEPEEILDILKQHFHRKMDLSKKVLITAGPTHEKIDPVRYIGNYSTGKMGFSLAEEAASRGAEVTLVTGPTSLTVNHPAISRVDTISAEEMYNRCMELSREADIVIMAAAVADYSIREISEKKIKKSQASLILKLSPTKDILAEIGKNKKKKQFIVGFALETDDELRQAKKKLTSKNMDLVVLNSLNDIGAGFGLDTNKISIIDKNKVVYAGEVMSKSAVAAAIIDCIIKHRKGKS